MGLQSPYLGSFYEPGKALHTPQAQCFPVSSVGSLRRSEERRKHSTLKILIIRMALASQQCFYFNKNKRVDLIDGVSSRCTLVVPGVLTC